MKHFPGLFALVFLSSLLAGGGLLGSDRDSPLDLSEYRTVENAVTTQISRSLALPGRSAGFLGIAAEPGEGGKLVVAQVAADSPAAKAGVRPGDVIARLDGRPVASQEALRIALGEKGPGDSFRLTLERQGKTFETTGTLAPLSRPMAMAAGNAPSARGILGVGVDPAKEGVQIAQVVAGSAASKAKLKEGEIVLKVNGVAVANPGHFAELLTGKRPEETVTLTLFLADKAVDLKVKLEAEPAAAEGGRGQAAWNMRAGNYWRKDVFRLGLILIDYPDVKHNPKVTAKAWEDAMFSRGKYLQTATGQPAFGSLADYYHEQSYGRLKVEGKAYEPIEVSKKRAEYGEGSNRSALLIEALEKIEARDGPDAFKDIDGVCFIYSGGRMNVPRGSLYWPHRSSVSYKGKRWPYFICADGGERMANISVFCHEFGHMLGLPDLYARPENPGSEGVSVWCAMSNQAPNGRPQHFCAWSKEKLEWIEPCVIDPTVPQKLILAPIEDSRRECFKVLVRRDGSEYLLLENRRKKGFDTSLPAEGLLIWRVVQNRPFLEESHGVDGPAGPRVHQSFVPYPSAANDAFTPYTTPSSRSQLGGGLPVHVTNIRRLPDGRIAFHIGYEYQ